ncbi:794_t:CDS:1, partial [Racocetra fulgida]
VQTCNLLAGKSYQITESLEIWLEPSALRLCFREQKQVDYKLELHPRLVDYYLVEIKKEY